MGRHGSFALVAATLALAALPAQDAGTTLARLADRSDHVVVVRVLANRADGVRREVAFRSVEVLAGAPPTTFVLTEPDGRACGQALFGMLPGSGHLAFLRERDGRLVGTASGARALPRLEPGRVDHVRALLASRAAARRTPVWVAALAVGDDRVRRDAAMDLARSPLATPPEFRARLAAAIGRTIERVDAPELLDLAHAAARAEAVGALDPLLAALCRGEAVGVDGIDRGGVAAAVAAFPAAAVAIRLRAELRANPSADPLRALAVLDVADRELAIAVAPAILTASRPERRDVAGVALLRAGVPEAVVAPHATGSALAEWRRRAERLPRFQSIDPRGRR